MPDSITFGPGFGSLGWAARESSKPGREREQDCWVVQSSLEAVPGRSALLQDTWHIGK